MSLQVDNLHKQFKTRHGSVIALKDINVNIEEGEFIGSISTLLERMN